MFRALIPENVFKILHHLSNDLLAPAGDGVVLAFHHFQGGMSAVCLQIPLAAPHRHDAVAITVQQEHGALIGRRNAVDVELLRGEEVFSPQLIQPPTADVFRRVLGVEACVEELATLTGLLDDRAWGDKHHTQRDRAFPGSNPSGKVTL